MLLKVGLTGGIASGKSIVLKILASLGCHTINADQIVHALYGPGSEVTRRLAETFSPEIMDGHGQIDRKKLGKIVFSDAEKRKVLNDIVHPAVLAEEKKLLEEFAVKAPEGIAVVDAALMIEAGSFIFYDKIIVVVADREIRLKRLMLRDACTESEALSRIKAQMPEEEKRKFGDYVIENNGPREALEKKAREVYACLAVDQNRLKDRHV